MKIWGDYHTHTIFSHGKGTIEDNIKVAEEKGLKELAITDHSFSHKLYNVLRKDIPVMRRQIEALKDKYNVKVYLGVEANLLSMNGDIDVLPEDEEKLDIILMGFHKIIYAKTFKDRFKFFLMNNLSKIFGVSEKRLKINTNAYLRAIEKNNIDIITHLGYGMPVNAIEIAKACKEHNVYLELNGKRILFKPEEMKDIIATGVKFIIDSDAHSAKNVGESPLGIKFALKYNIPLEQIANIDKLPKFKKHR